MAKNVRRILAVVFVGAAIVLVLAQIRLRSQEKLHRAEILRRCVAASSEEAWFQCFSKELPRLVRTTRLDELLALLETIFEDQQIRATSGFLSCHEPAHLLGEQAIGEGKSFAAVARECSRRCDYGCFHGALIASMRQDPALSTKVSSLCDTHLSSSIPKDANSCYHMVGHGLSELYAKDIGKALAYCDDIDSVDGQKACGEGTLMEYFVGSHPGQGSVKKDVKDPLAFCAGLSGVYQGICYENLGRNVYDAMRDKEQVFPLCQKAPQQFQSGCVASLGARSYFRYQNAPDRFIDFCKKTGSWHASCFQGGLEAAVSVERTARNALKLCELSLEEQCYEAVGEIVAWGYGQAQRQDVCRGVPTERRSACLGKSGTR